MADDTDTITLPSGRTFRPSNISGDEPLAVPTGPAGAENRFGFPVLRGSLDSEKDIIQRESGGRPYIGWGDVDLSKAPLDKYGFPIWEGRPGPKGVSHAAGLYQFEPATWREGASALGITDFSPESQKRVFDYIHGKYGNAPWAESAPGTASGRGVRPGEQTEGGTYIGTVGLDRTGLSPVGSALLANMLKDRYGAAEEPTGNALLDGLLQSSLFGTTEQAPQPSPTDIAAKQLQQAAPPPPPATVPELAGGQPSPTPRMQPIQQPAMPSIPQLPPSAPPTVATLPDPTQAPAPPGAPPELPQPKPPGGFELAPMERVQAPPLVPSTPMPGQPSVPAAPPVQPVGMPIPPSSTQGDFYQQNWQTTPPPVYQQETPGTAQAPGSADRNRFFNEGGVAPYSPPGVPDDRQQEAAAPTGDNILDRILKQVSPISTAQAAEREPPPQPAPQPQAQQQAPPANTGNSLLDGLLKWIGQGEAGEQEQQSAVAGQPFYEKSKITPVAEALAEPFDLLAKKFVVEPLEAGRQIGESIVTGGGPQPGSPEAYEAAASAAQLGVMGGAPRGSAASGFGRGPGGPRVEPPPLRAGDAGGRPPVEPPPPPSAAQPPTNPPPGSPPPPLTPPPEGSGPIIEPPTFADGKKVAADRLRLHDDLNWTVRSGYADAIQSKQFYDEIPAEFKTPEFRARVGYEIEQRLIDPNAPLSPETERFLKEVKPLTDAEHDLGTQLAKHGLTEEQADELGISLRTVDQGHVHRMVEGQQLPGEILPTNIDPITGRPRGSGGRNLGKTASGMKQRTDYFVGQDDVGNRVWVPKRLGEQMPPPQRGYTRFYSDDRGGWVTDRNIIRKRNPTGRTTRYVDFPTTQAGQFRVRDEFNLPDAQRNSKLAPPEKYGDRYQQGHTSYTAREPTMREVEANTPIRYHHDYLLGLFNNVGRLRTVLRNLNVIERQKELLGPEGARLWQPREGKFLHTPPTYVDARGQTVPFQRVNLPQMDGWAHPRIANTINDFVGNFGELTTLEKIDNVLIGSMFILPFGHIRNVGAHAVIGRGLDWAHRSPRLLQSLNEVWHMGPIYQRWLRENGPAMYPGAADVHGKLVEKLLSDMAHDPGWEVTAKTIGTTMKKLLPEMYKWSQRTLWFANDHMFLARTLENLAKLGQRDPLNAPSAAWKRAIADTKREIPPYEMPDQVLGSRAFRNLLMRQPIAFGRYTYDKYRILGENVLDMLGKGPHGRGMPQLQGAAQALITLMLSFPVLSVMNSALQRLTGNENAKFYGAGPISIIRAAGIGAGKLAGVDPNSALGWSLGMTDDEVDLSHALSGMLTLTPGLSTFIQIFGGGHNPYSGMPIVGKGASPEGTASQILTFLATNFYPTNILMRALREGPGALTEPLGFDLAGREPPSAKAQLFQKRMEAARERKDPVQDLLERGTQWFQQNSPSGGVDYGRAGF